MSETDDTDDLLLIPPDFFVNSSDVEDTAIYGPYYNVVENLISQVSNIENRLNCIETSADNSGNSSIDYLMSNSQTSSMAAKNKYDLLSNYICSTQSTPQKPREKFKLNSLPSTPSTLDTSNTASQFKDQRPLNFSSFYDQQITNRKESLNFKSLDNVFLNCQKNMLIAGKNRVQKEMLCEIDNFISNVNTIKRHDVARSLTNEFDNSTARAKSSNLNEHLKDSLHSRFNINDINELINSIKSHNQIRITNSELTVAQNSCKPSHESTGLIERCDSIESNNISTNSSNVTQLTAVNRTNVADANSDVASNSVNTITASEQSRGNQSSLSLYRNEVFSNDSTGSPRKDNLTSINLAELWKQKGLDSLEYTADFNHLQEEKLRRQHCEQLIQKLQMQSLELQEKLAVAIEVDKAKDEAIVQIHNSWLEAVSKIDVLLKDKSNHENQVSVFKMNVSRELSEAAKKVNHYEQESLKALDLAHNNYEKVKTFENENALLSTEVQSYKQKLEALQKDYESELRNNHELSKILNNKEIEISKKENILLEAKKEVSQSKKAITTCHGELDAIREVCSKLQSQIQTQLENTRQLEIEKTKLLRNIDEMIKNEKKFRDNLSDQKHINEQNKIELRNFYQNQAEAVIQNKLVEFQSQLDKAENVLQEKIRNCEFAIAKTAALHIQQLIEKHELEIQLIEEKHKEEVKLVELQSYQMQKQINNLHSKLCLLQERKTDIAQQLHHVMEVQWLEVIKILNNDKTPILSKDKCTNTIDQLNHLKSKSFTNVEEILKDDSVDIKTNGDLKALESSISTFHFSTDKLFLNAGAYGDGKFSNINSEDTPRNRPGKQRQQTENELQKYIQILLNNTPTSCTTSAKYKKQKNSISNTEEPFNWHSLNTDDEVPSSNKQQKNGIRDFMSKPPWK